VAGRYAPSVAVLEKALADACPGVRRHAVRLGEGQLAKSPELADSFLKLIDDADPQVRIQLAYSLGEWDDSRAGQALGKLALKAGDDPYLLPAAMSSINKKNLGPVMRTVLAERTHAGPHLTENLLRMTMALDDKQGLAELLREVSRSQDGQYATWQFADLASLFDALDQLHSSLTKLEESGSTDLKEALHGLTGILEAARAIASTKSAEQNLR